MPSNRLIDALMAHALTAPETRFISERGRDSHTFGEFFAGVRKMASVLAMAGLGPGDRVAAQIEKSVAGLQLYLGTIMAGGVYLPLNPAYTTDEVGYFLGDATPKIFVCDPARKSRITGSGASGGVEHVFTLDHDGTGSFAQAAAQQIDDFAPVYRDSEDLAAILDLLHNRLFLCEKALGGIIL